MLIEFKVENFRSIRDIQTLSMVASTGTELPQNVCSSGISAKLQLVRSAVIYGPNAAGKSNLIKALYFMQWLIKNSAKESQQGDQIPLENFLFDKKVSQQPSKFEITFSKDNIRYQYGFILSKKNIIEEWLLAYPSDRPQQWFLRKYNEKKGDYEWKFSSNFEGGKQQHILWQTSTRNNALFLSTAVQLNNQQLISVFNFFQNDLIVSSTRELRLKKSIEQIKSQSGKQWIIKYINIADPSITDIILESEKFSKETLSDKLPQEIKDLIIKEMTGEDIVKISLKHVDNILDLSDESDGTQKFLEFAGLWADVLENGRVVVVDELNTSLHPLVVKFLVNLMSNHNENKKNAQLIFTTHDTSLLDDEIFRRDQIWFVEKDNNISTQLYPLLDFSPRKHEAIGKGYLQGRYGALPYIGEWKF